MAGVDFNREAFVPTAERGQPPARMLGGLVLLVVITLIVFLGYKLFSGASQSAPASVESSTLEGVQQQLAKIEKRLDQLERRRKSSTESDAAPNAAAKTLVEKSPSKKTLYSIAPAGGTNMQQPLTQAMPRSQTPSVGQARNNGATEDREIWQATTDRLADVVGVVDSQENEITEARRQLNALLAETRRNAITFELGRGASPQPVGPVSMALKGSDPKSQHYTLCVYLDDKCVELKNRSVNEVVVFVLSPNAAPVKLVATKVLREQIVGYLEVPTEKATP